MTTVTRTILTNLDEILKSTPKGLVAMFIVSSMSADAPSDGWNLGHVYVKNGRIYDFMSDQCHGSVDHFGLHFVDYIKL